MKLVAVELPYRIKAKKQITIEVAVLTGNSDEGVDICINTENQDHWQPILTLTNEGKIRLRKVSDYYGFLRNDDGTILIE